MSTVIGSVPRTKNQKLSEIRSVRDFGAVGDGVTDDLQAIRNAIGSLPQNLNAPLGPDATVTTSGTSVARESGIPFDVSLKGQTVGIAGSNYQVFKVIDTDNLVLLASAGVNASPVAFVRYANHGLIQLPDPPSGTYLLSNTLLVSPFVSLTGVANTRVHIQLQPGVAEATAFVVSASGTAVTRISGPKFTQDLAGMRGIIAGQPYDIFSVVDTDHLTLTTLAPVAGPVAMAIETWVVKVLLAGDSRGSIEPAANFTENCRLENLWIDGGWEDGAHNQYSSCLYFPTAQISSLRNILLSEGGQRGLFCYGSNFTVYENVWSNSHGIGPGADFWNCHDLSINGLWVETVNGSGTALDGDGDYMPGTRFQNCRNAHITAWDGENCKLPLKIAGSTGIVLATAFLNGNIAVPPVGCVIRDLVYNGATSNGVRIDRAQTADCAVAILDTSVSYVSGQPRNIAIPGAPSWHGVVDTSGTAVTLVSGTPFTSALVGLFPSIDGVFAYQVLSVADANNLILNTTAGTQHGVSFDCVPFNYNIQYEQDKYIPSFISRTGRQLAISDDDAINLQDRPLRSRGTSGGVSELQGAAAANEPEPIASITNPTLGAVTVQVTGYGWTTGTLVRLSGISGQLRLNDCWYITVVDADNFTLDGAVGDGTASLGGSAELAHGYRMLTEFDDILLASGFTGNPRDFLVLLGSQIGLRMTAGEVSGGVARWTTDQAFQQPISFPIPIKGSAGSTDSMQGNVTISGNHYWLFQTVFDFIRLQAGNTANPQSIELQRGTTGFKVSLESSGVKIYQTSAAGGGQAMSVDDNDAVFGGPIYPQTTGAFTSAIYSGNGSPEGALAAKEGSIYLNQAGGSGVGIYVKETGSGNTGWVAASGGFWGPVVGDPTAIETLFRVGINKAPGSGLDLDTSGAANFGGNTKVSGTFESVGDATFDGFVKLNGSGITPGEPLFSNSSKDIFSSKVDVANSSQVIASGFTAGDFPRWDGSEFAPRVLTESDVTNLVSDLASLSTRITAIENALGAAFTGTKSSFPVLVNSGLVQP